MTGEELVARAEAAAQQAYAPYSNYLVGAALLLKDGRVFEGVNVENAAYPLGVCAERTAISKAASDGVRPGDIDAIGDHRIAVRRLPPVAARVEDRARRLPPRRRLDRGVRAGARLPDTWDLPD